MIRCSTERLREASEGERIVLQVVLSILLYSKRQSDEEVWGQNVDFKSIKWEVENHTEYFFTSSSVTNRPSTIESLFVLIGRRGHQTALYVNA